MDGQQNSKQEVHKQDSSGIEHFLKATFDNLPPQSKALVGLFLALNSASSLTTRFELPDHLWESVRFGHAGPVIGQSEEINWLKGVADGILLIADHI